jgi:uncharacterized protein (TIGR03086 family)
MLSVSEEAARMPDIRDLDRRALAATVKIVNQSRRDQLDLPTPCEQWSLRQLLAHMTGQNYGFAASADGERTDRTIFDDRPVDEDPHGIFAQSAARVSAAFDADGVLDRRLWLPEIRDGMTFPAAQAIGFHFLDYVVHGWDVARAIGVAADFDPQLVDEALAGARQVPAGASRERPGAAFKQIIEVDEDAAPQDKLVAILGRSPSWPR